MKKVFALLLTLLALLLCACAEEDTPAVISTDDTTKASLSFESEVLSENMDRFNEVSDEVSAVVVEESVFVKESGVEYGSAADGKVALSVKYTDSEGNALVGYIVQFSKGAVLDKYTTDGEGKIYIESINLDDKRDVCIIGLDGNGIFFGTVTVLLAESIDATPVEKDVVYYADPFSSTLNITTEVTDGQLKIRRLNAE